MEDSSVKYAAAAELCRVARSEYRAYCQRTQSADYEDTAYSDLSEALFRQFGPTGVWDPRLAKSLSFQAHLYLGMAEQHMHGLQTLLEGVVPGLPLGPAARSVAEASGRAVWLLDNRLGLERGDARRRVARLLLDREEGERIRKRVAYDFDHPQKAETSLSYILARDAIRRPGCFYASEIDIDPRTGIVTLCGERLPGPSGFVRIAGEIFGDDPGETAGLYGYVSAMTHPTVFAFVETMSDLSSLPEGWTEIPWNLDGEFATKLASNAVRSFYNAWRAWIGWTNTGMDEAFVVHNAHVALNNS